MSDLDLRSISRTYTADLGDTGPSEKLEKERERGREGEGAVGRMGEENG